LATLTPSGLPKVRFVIHRASKFLVWWPCSRPVSPSSHFLVTTTDTRMQKPNHLASHSDVEVAWWIEATNVQFRFAGQGITIASPKVEPASSVSEKLKKLSPVGDEADPAYWEKERARLWKEVSGHLRAGFARPAPGTPLDQADRKPEEWSESIPAESVGTRV
jgi:pyridoxamine 5'-phosphate oxidase